MIIKKMHDMSISLIALETYISSDILRNACKDVFSSMENIYIQKLINYGIDREKANYIGTAILAITEGALTISLSRKSGESLRRVAKQISTLVK